MRIVKHTQGSPEWHAWRRLGIGGSDAPAIMGASPYTTRQALLDEKLGLTRREENFAMARGHRLEPQARGIYCIKKGCTADPVCVIHETHDWIKASLDGLVYGALNQPSHIIQIKAYGWQKHDYAINGILPDEAWPQIQHELMASGLSVCDFICYNPSQKYLETGEEFACFPVHADPAYQVRLFEEELRFWEELNERLRRKSAPSGWQAPIMEDL